MRVVAIARVLPRAACEKSWLSRRLWWSKPELATITRKAERRHVARIDRIIANAAPETAGCAREVSGAQWKERPPVVVIERRDRSHDPELSAGEEQRWQL